MCGKVLVFPNEISSHDNVRSKNSRTPLVGQDIINCIFLDGCVLEFLDLTLSCELISSEVI